LGSLCAVEVYRSEEKRSKTTCHDICIAQEIDI
jgi:hypothetical protein